LEIKIKSNFLVLFESVKIKVEDADRKCNTLVVDFLHEKAI
jgi:hypothetical protein